METNYVSGLAGRSGDPSPVTAHGVFRAIQAAAKHLWGRDDVSGRRERVRGNEHLVARLEPERKDCEVERRGPGGDDERVLDRARARDLVLELGDLRPHREDAALEHAGDLVELSLADVRQA